MNQSYLPKLKTGMGNMARSFLLLCLFPHYLIYLGMLYYLAAEARKVGEDKNKKRMAAMILILTFFVGILSESILSKIFLKNFLQYIGM